MLLTQSTLYALCTHDWVCVFIKPVAIKNQQALIGAQINRTRRRPPSPETDIIFISGDLLAKIDYIAEVYR